MIADGLTWLTMIAVKKKTYAYYWPGGERVIRRSNRKEGEKKYNFPRANESEDSKEEEVTDYQLPYKRVLVHKYISELFFFLSTVRRLSVLMMTINGSRAAVAVGVRCPVVSIMCSGPPGAEHRGYRPALVDTLYTLYCCRRIPAIPEGVTNSTMRIIHPCVNIHIPYTYILYSYTVGMVTDFVIFYFFV